MTAWNEFGELFLAMGANYLGFMFLVLGGGSFLGLLYAVRIIKAKSKTHKLFVSKMTDSLESRYERMKIRFTSLSFQKLFKLYEQESPNFIFFLGGVLTEFRSNANEESIKWATTGLYLAFREQEFGEKKLSIIREKTSFFDAIDSASKVEEMFEKLHSLDFKDLQKSLSLMTCCFDGLVKFKEAVEKFYDELELTEFPLKSQGFTRLGEKDLEFATPPREGDCIKIEPGDKVSAPIPQDGEIDPQGFKKKAAYDSGREPIDLERHPDLGEMAIKKVEEREEKGGGCAGGGRR